MNSQEALEYVLRNRQPLTVKSVEYRLYYNSDGTPRSYSTEDLEGEYIVVDQKTYNEGNYHIEVVNGQIQDLRYRTVVHKLVPDTTGTACDASNVMLVERTGTNYWKRKTYEG